MEKHIETKPVLNGGTIELWKIESFFYVKSTVKGVVKYSEAVTRFKAESFMFDAVYYGGLDF